ncbi:MAG: class I SAM-dependent methyltransferase [Thermoproteota archaeon]|nr:class I SAM-dependent methyltransferase [Thermoproteota archaeon]
MSGLGNAYWHEVIDVLRSIIPVYDRVNRAISLGQDIKYREEGINGRVNPGDLVLDAGSGFGNMTSILLKILDNNVKIVMFDPIREMLQNAKEYLPSENSKNLSCGVFEVMPFRDRSFDAVLCGYCLRDAISLEGAISEIHRILRDSGRFVIVDLGKPDNFFLRYLVSFYLKYFLGILAFSVSGKSGLKFKTLYGTYTKWPRNGELYLLLTEKFSKVVMERKLFGGAIIVVGYK